jgi:L,D-peptidoglycan transpeptidase YkuD (ErfK/YbiS/YcfS/YnhG family)
MKTLRSLLLFAAVPLSLSAQVKKPQPPPVKVPFAESLQAVVVVTKDWNATQGTARRYERKSRTAKWKAVGESFPVVVGRSGLGKPLDELREDASFTSALQIGLRKMEGDGKSPAGLFPLTFVFGAAEKPEQLTFPYTKLEKFTECVDDIKSNHYNKIVNRMQVGSYDWKSSEKMLEIGPPYELGVFVAYNSYPAVKGNGSCIFLHVWKDASRPTSGCTAMGRIDLERIVGWLEPELNPYLVQLPESEYKSLRKPWNLPKLK